MAKNFPARFFQTFGNRGGSKGGDLALYFCVCVWSGEEMGGGKWLFEVEGAV